MSVSTSVAWASGNSVGTVQMYSCSADSGRDAARLERLLQPAEVGERAADHQLRLALLPGALAHLIETVIDEVQLEVVLVDAARGSGETRPSCGTGS